MRGLRVLRLIPVMLSALLSFALICLWSYTSWVDNVRLTIYEPAHLSVNVQQGRLQFQRTYRFKETIPTAQYHAAPIPPQRIVPRPTTFLGFSYSSGHEQGHNMPFSPDTLVLADYWILNIPIWAVLVMVSVPWVYWLMGWWLKNRRRRTGFEVVTG